MAESRWINAGVGGSGYGIQLCNSIRVDAELDLTAASREVLIAIIAQQQTVVLEQQAVIERLERRIETLARLYAF